MRISNEEHRMLRQLLDDLENRIDDIQYQYSLDKDQSKEILSMIEELRKYV